MGMSPSLSLNWASHQARVLTPIPRFWHIQPESDQGDLILAIVDSIQLKLFGVTGDLRDIMRSS